MSHIVAIFHTDDLSLQFFTQYDDGDCANLSAQAMLDELHETGQSVERLPEVGECILVDPPAPRLHRAHRHIWRDGDGLHETWERVK